VITGIISIKTEPPGAKIFRKPFNKTESDWEFIGVSPIDSMYMPNYLYNWKFEKPGYETLYRQFWSRGPLKFSTGKFPAGNQECILDKKGTLPQNIVRIPGTDDMPDFLIDKYEITNKQFKHFMDSSGYQDKTYWKIPFIKNDKELSWEEAMTIFRDATGRLGPALWEGGSYPEGEDNLPINGVSWYEAAAYAEFADKSLPTVKHWGAARRGSLGMLSHLFYPLSNFGGKGPVPVGMTEAITQFGVYDMAGNVREWCWNKSEKGNCIRGGAWNDVHYMYNTITQADPFDRSSKNGIRCVFYLQKGKIPLSYFASRITGKTRDFYKETPVSDPIFEIYKNMFMYDLMDLKTVVEETNEESSYWIYQKITFSAPYDDERIIIHLFLPRNITPPYQTVIYFPGSGSVFVPSSDDIEDHPVFFMKLSHFIKNGRAVVYPVYKGTFERRDGLPGSLHKRRDESHEYKDYNVKIVKDCKRVIDYLETRPDIDAEKIAYFGFSWGGILGSVIPAVEGRIKIAIIDAGGLIPVKTKTKPEVDPINYISRVTIPTLMLHGKFDANISYDKSAKPMFDLLGTPEKDKKLIVYESDHVIPRKELIKESLDWLDRYLGPVK
jgi:predicted esterase